MMSEECLFGSRQLPASGSATRNTTGNHTVISTDIAIEEAKRKAEKER
jgi:hypothetical protein